MKEKKSNFSGSIGFVLAAAGSAVGVGNIWRFPYLCAKDGGGLFLIVYLALVLSFGFVLLTTDIAIGRHTKQNALKAFGTLNSKWKFLGYLTFLVPALIMTYYSVIGGWITKYFCTYVVSDGSILSQLFYILYHFQGFADRIHAAVSGFNCLGCIPWCGKGNRKIFTFHYAWTDPADPWHCDFFSDAFVYRCKWNGSHRTSGT